MSFDAILLTVLKNIFSTARVDRCYCCESGAAFGIVEQNHRACIVASINGSSTPCFWVSNPSKTPAHFIALDGCFFTDADVSVGKRADCILFDAADFCFIELKLNVTSHKQRSARTNEALEQLGNTIEYFKTQFKKAQLAFLKLGFRYEAYIVFRTPIYPRTSAQSTQRATQFLLQHGVRLHESNQKVLNGTTNQPTHP